MEAAKKIFTRAHIIWFLLLNFGLVLLAAGIHFFKSPNNFAMGGPSGVNEHAICKRCASKMY